jgi:hypothetical protein
VATVYIADFNHAAERFQLENAIFTKLGAGVHALSPLFFRGGAAAADADDFIVYDQANGLLSYDPNGTQPAPWRLRCSRTVRRSANDFAVI